MSKTTRRDYTLGELKQLARRRMIQRNHGDDKWYKRKKKHKNRNYDDDES